ncbi:MAG: cytidylyltransferase domain-containing protein [Alphaproteobacteria bacterium]
MRERWEATALLKGRPLTAVIPVRGGSRGIPGKNMYMLGGMSLLERTIRLTARCPRIDRTLVSTDSPEMFALAERFGVAPPDLRPAHLATSEARSVDVVADLVERAAVPAGWILLLQVTSPLATLADLDDMLDGFARTDGAEAMVSLSPYEGPHPEKMQVLRHGRVASYLGGEPGRPRQGLPDLYVFNGAFYLIDRDRLLEGRSFVPEGTLPFVMPAERSANLDTPLDLQILEAMLETGRWRLEGDR